MAFVKLNIPVKTKFKEMGFKKKLVSILGVAILIPSIVTVFVLNTSFSDSEFCPVTFFCQTKAADPSSSQLLNMFGLSIDPNNKNESGGLPKMEELNELNVKWVRIELIENPVINYKELFTLLHQNNKKILLIVDYASIRNTPKPNSKIVKVGDPLWATYRAKYIQKVRDAATEYKDLVDAWEIWNEPDLYVNDQYDPYVPPAEFAKFLKEASNAIRSSGANGTLLVGGLASGNAGYLRDTIAFYGNTLLEYDGVGIHPYGQRPDNFNNSWGFGHIDTLLTNYYSMTPKPLWITEIGTDDLAVQAEYLSKFYDTIKRKHLTRVPVVIWFCYSDAMVSPFGLIDANGNRKPSYNAYKSVLASNGVLPAASIYDPPEHSKLLATSGTFKLTAIGSTPLKYKLTIKRTSDNTIVYLKDGTPSTISFDVSGLPSDGSDLTSTLDTIYSGATVSINQKYIAYNASTNSDASIEDANWSTKIYENIDLSGLPTVSKDIAPASTDEPKAVGGINLDWGWTISPDGSKLPFKVNDYSIRFDRKKYFDEGLYKFKLVVDEGAKVYIDNVLIIDKWDNKAFNTAFESPNISISKGLHRITVAYFEKSDTANIKFWWEKLAFPSGSTPTPTQTPTVILNKAASIISPAAGTTIPASTTSLNIAWSSGSNVKSYDVKVSANNGATLKEISGLASTVLSQTYQVNLAGTTEINILLKTNFNDLKSESATLSYKIPSDFTLPPIDNSTSTVKLNATGLLSMQAAPVVQLVVERQKIKTTYDSQSIYLTQDYTYKLPNKLHTGDKVYFRFCNDTSTDGKCGTSSGSANRDLIFNYAVIDGVVVKFQQNVSMADGKLGPIADIKYDRANKEDASLYDWGKLRDVSSTDGNFGTYDDGKAVFYGGENFSWGVKFNGFMPFNGAIVINVNWQQ